MSHVLSRLMEELRDVIITRRLIEGVYIIDRDNYENVVGFIVNSSQACGVLVNVRRAEGFDIGQVTKIELSIPELSIKSEPPSGYFWLTDSVAGVDLHLGSVSIRPPLLILDDVRNSDNVGVILRTAYSLGIRSLVVTETSFSALGCRAARTSMGALFFFGIMISTDLVASIKDLKRRGIEVYSTSPRGKKVKHIYIDCFVYT